jgi:peptidoglycan biosynthesis protein MviN/MurJ (putative lipid II flippase)
MVFLYLILIVVIHNIQAKIKNIIKNPAIISVGLVSGLYLLSRIMGLGRTILISKNLDKVSSDIFLKADFIPNQISSILLMGTIISSVLPIASRLLQKEKKGDNEDYTKTYNYFNLVSGIIIVALFVIIALCQIFLDPLLSALIDTETYQKYLELGKMDEFKLSTRILLLTPLNFAVQALFGVLLNLKDRFNIYALAGAVTNIGAIGGVLVATSSNFISLPIGMLLGGFVSCLIYVFYAVKDGYRFPANALDWVYWSKLFRIYSTELKDTAKTFLPRIFLIDGFLVSYAAMATLKSPDGQITAFDFATSIQGAFYILISSIGIILFPNISRIVNDKSIKLQEFWERMHKYLQMTIFLGLVVSVLAIPGSYLVIKIFESFGKLQGTEQNSYIILLTSVSSFRLFFMAIKEVLDKIFYSRESKYLPIGLSVIANIFQIIFIWTLSNYYDVGVVASVGLMVYYAVWVILALLRVRWEVRDLK